MNRGNTENKPPQSESRAIERLNQLLGRLMGKKPSAQQPAPRPEKIPSNHRFAGIFVGMLGVLWLLTGIYYIPDASYGLILNEGQVSQVVKGLKVGVSYPYPFTDVITLDAGVSNFSIGKTAEQSYLLASRDQQNIAVQAEVAYTISDPQAYYVNSFQDDSDTDSQVRNLVEVEIQQYFQRLNAAQILSTSTIVMANEIRDAAQLRLKSSGISLENFSVVNLQNKTSQAKLPVLSAPANESDLAQAIVREAQRYKLARESQTLDLVANYNSLLPQYQANKNAIAELMYYKMLSSLPQSPSVESYPLLNLTQAEFLAKVAQPANAVSATDDDIRAVNRGVDRERIYKGF